MLFISDSVFLETNKNSDNSSLFEEFQWLVLFVVMNSKNVFSKSFLMPFFLLTTWNLGKDDSLFLWDTNAEEMPNVYSLRQ